MLAAGARRVFFLLLLAPALVRDVCAQLPADIARERADFTAWLATAPTSPLAAVAQQAIGPELRLGPTDSDVPLEGVVEARLTASGGIVRLEGAGGTRVVAPGAPTPLGRYTIVVDGPAGRRVVTVFGQARPRLTPAYFDYRPALSLTGTLTPPAHASVVRILDLDGIEVDAVEAGTLELAIGGRRVQLRTRQVRTGSDESELEIFFRDSTNGGGSYPAGRFVPLESLGPRTYRVDFNRARNPFCAYSSVYACPAPWPGGVVPARIEAGERYEAPR